MQTAFTILPFLFAVLLAALYLPPARIAFRAKAAWTVWFFVCAAKFACFAVFGASAFAPELPEKLIWAWNWAYSGMCIMLAMTVLCRLAAAPWRRRSVYDRPFSRMAWIIILPATAWGVAARGVYNGLKTPSVKELAIEFESLPESLDGYRIVHATDIHASAASRRWRTEKIVAAINSLDADLVCLTGDYSDGLCAAQCSNVEPLGALKARDGVVAVTGNHEYYYDVPAWAAFYKRIGMRFLDGECVHPRRNLAVAGVADPAAVHAFLPPPSTAGLFLDATNGEFRILLQHRPHAGIPPPEARCDLQLSGHTHGGVAPLMDKLVAHWNDGMVKGLYDGTDGRKIYVSTGAGQWAGFPIRFFDDPEIALITLRRKAAEPGK